MFHETNRVHLLIKTEVNSISFLQVPLAREAGLCYAAVALVTDYDCWREMEDSEHVRHLSQFLPCLPHNPKALAPAHLRILGRV